MAELGGLNLGQKIGPFPLGVWVLGGAGGIAVAYFMNRSLAGGGGGGGGSIVGESGVGGMGGFMPIQPDEPEDTGGPLDNEAWAFAALTWLVGQGYNAVEAGVAVRRYLDGEPLDSSQATMIDRVTKSTVGAPPTVPVGGGVGGPPVPEPPKLQVPGPISGLKVTQLSDVHVSLGWNAAERASGYHIQRVFPGTSGAQPSFTTRYDSRSHVGVTPLKPSRQYQFRVRGYNSGGTGPWSTVSFTSKAG